MFKGFVLSESLRDPVILNEFRTIYVRVESHPESAAAPFWHLFKIGVEDRDVETVAHRFAHALKPAWYAHFWNEEMVYVALPGKVLSLRREKEWSSPEFQIVKAEGMKAGIAERYLDFWIED